MKIKAIAEVNIKNARDTIYRHIAQSDARAALAVKRPKDPTVATRPS
jgi:hypothetical protein